MTTALAIIQADDFPVLDSPHALPVTWTEIASHGDEWIAYTAKTLKAPAYFALGEYLSDRLGVIVRNPFIVFADDGDMIYFKMWRHGRE